MDKQTYCFIGTESHIGELTLEKFGTEVLLDAKEALNAIEGGAQLVPKDQFNFTEQEVSLYPYPAFRADAPEAFHVKHRAAVAAVQEHLALLKEQNG